MKKRDRKDYTISVEEGKERYEEASEKALDRVADLGIDPYEERPRDVGGEYFDGRLPNNANSLALRELGDLYNLMDNWTNWVASYAVAGKAEVSNKKEQLDLVYARVYKTKEGTVEDKKKDTICDERYVNANAKYLEASEYYLLLGNVESAGRRNLKVISRLIELRKTEFEAGRRGDNVGRGRDAFDRSKKKRPRRP